MSVVRWRCENFARFLGEQELILKPDVYSVVAIRDDDERRSNWSGKSWFLSSFGFAVTGEHPARLEDDWISRGEDLGLLEIELDSGVVIRRSRKRGKSTQVEVLGTGEKVGQKGAAQAIREVVGLSAEDFFATCCLQQKRIDQLISADPAARHELVSGWLDLGPLADACDRAAKRATAAENLAESLRQDLRAKEAVLSYSSDAGTPTDLRNEAAAFVLAAEGWDRQADELYEKVKQAEEHRRLKRAADEYAEVVREGKALAATAKPRPDNLEVAKLGDAQLRAHEAQKEARQAEAVAQGEFDGKCPVDCRKCPVADQINQGSKSGRARAAKLRKAADAAMDKASQAALELDGAKRANREADLLEGKLEALRARARALKPLADQWEATEDLEGPSTAEVVALKSKATESRRRAAENEFKASKLEQVAAERAGIEAKLDAAECEARTWLAASMILGRQGAQRRCAEEGLGQIEARANEVLSTAGIDLSLVLSWFRQGGDLAKRCAECGEPFPSTTTVRQCSRCGEPRGKNLIEKLEVVQSDTSGAANDLSGLVLQVAAAGWLRAKRGAAWDTLLIDEPFGACDEANRLALSAALVSMCKSGGFSQALVSGHSRDVLERMPARVIIRAGNEWSNVEVG